MVDLGISGYGEAVQIGRGGFAVVYRAWQPDFQREVAIKVISATLDPTGVQRFERECRAIGALSGHPNVVTVYEMGLTGDGRPFISMEYLPGGSLGDRVAETGPLPWHRVVEVGIKLSGALAWAHSNNVLHRDVKPENVLVSRFGEHKLADFGIARVQGSVETNTGVVTATFAHAAPEVLDGQRPSQASDVYSLGSTLFALIAGRAPFARDGDETLLPMLGRIAAGATPDLRPAGVPQQVCAIIERALQKDATARQADAEEVGRQLQDAQARAGLAVTHLPLDAGQQRGEAAGFTVRIPADQATGPGVTERVQATETLPPGSAGPHYELPAPPPAAAPPAGEAMPASSRGRRWWPAAALMVGLAATIAAVVLARTLGDGGSKGDGGKGRAKGSVVTTTSPPGTAVPDPVIFRDDFSNPSTGWSRSDVADYVTEYSNGQYRMLLKKAQISLPRTPRSTTGLGSIQLEADARNTSDIPGRFGLACRYSGNGKPYYYAVIAPDGFWAVYRQVSGAPERKTLASGTSTFPGRADRPQDLVYHLRLDCEGSVPTTLRLFVNGVKAGEATDAEGLPAGNVALVTATTDKEGVEVVFDNFVVSRLP